MFFAGKREKVLSLVRANYKYSRLQVMYILTTLNFGAWIVLALDWNLYVWFVPRGIQFEINSWSIQ